MLFSLSQALDDRFGPFRMPALAALRPDVGLHDGHAELRAFFLDEFEFFLCVGGESVKSNDYRQTEGEHIFDMLLKVRDARFKGRHVDFAEIPFRHASRAF